MTEKKQLQLLKLAAAAMALYYMYRVSKANGGTLKGNNMGIKVNSDRIVDLASHFVPEDYRPQARQMGKNLIDRMLQ